MSVRWLDLVYYHSTVKIICHHASLSLPDIEAKRSLEQDRRHDMIGKVEIDPMITYVIGLGENNTAADLFHDGMSIRCAGVN